MNLTILIVDDAKDWRDLLAGLVEDEYPQAVVLTADSSAAAKTVLNDYQVNLAILDIRLDDSDEANTEGLDLMNTIRAQFADTVALMITGYPTIEAVKRALKPGDNSLPQAMDFIEKGKINTEFLPHLKRILGSSGIGD